MSSSPQGANCLPHIPHAEQGSLAPPGRLQGRELWAGILEISGAAGKAWQSDASSKQHYQGALQPNDDDQQPSFRLFDFAAITYPLLSTNSLRPPRPPKCPAITRI